MGWIANRSVVEQNLPVVSRSKGGTVADVLDAQYPIEVHANQRGKIIGFIRC
jgi:hypothetical protein